MVNPARGSLSMVKERLPWVKLVVKPMTEIPVPGAVMHGPWSVQQSYSPRNEKLAVSGATASMGTFASCHVSLAIFVGMSAAGTCTIQVVQLMPGPWYAHPAE